MPLFLHKRYTFPLYFCQSLYVYLQKTYYRPVNLLVPSPLAGKAFFVGSGLPRAQQ